MCGRAVVIPEGAIPDDQINDAVSLGDLYTACAGLGPEQVPDDITLAMVSPKPGLIKEEHRKTIAEEFQNPSR
jgi:hypothetical protein